MSDPLSLTLTLSFDKPAINQNIKNAKLEMGIAEKSIGEILAGGLPQVKASADLGYNYKIQQILVPANIFDPTASPDDIIATEFGVPYVSNFGVTEC